MDDLDAYQRRLTRTARRRVADASSPQLAAIFDRVAQRRAHRSQPDHGGDRDAVWSVEDVAPDVRIIRTGKPPGFQFRAGQYTKLGVPGNRRGSYSLASAPHEEHLEFCVELIPGGRLSPALFRLRPGDRVEVDGRARGSFVLHSAASHLMIATVTGIAPLRSMIRDALHRGIDGEFVVLHGASHADELPYRDELLALAASTAPVEYHPTVSRPEAARNAGWPHATGRVDDLALAYAPRLDPRRTQVYACGHPEMVRRIRGELGGAFSVSTEVFD